MVNHFGLVEGRWSLRMERRNKRAESCCCTHWDEGLRQLCLGMAVTEPVLPTATHGWGKENGFLEQGKWGFMFW